MHWKVLLAIFTATTVLMSASYTMLIPFLPMYLIEELGVASEDVNVWSGMIFSSTFLISAIMAPIWGAIADKGSHKMMALRASICLTVAYMVGAIVTTPMELFWMRCFQGFSAGLWPACLALMTATLPKDKLGIGLGMMQGGSTAGSVLGPLMGGLLAEYLGMRASFWVSAAALGMITLLILLFIKEPKHEKTPEEAVKKPSNSWDLIRRPVIARMLFAAGVMAMSVMLIQPILPLYIAQVQGSMDKIVLISGIVFSIVGIAGVFGAPLWGRWGGTIGYRPILYSALLGTGIFGMIQALPGTLEPFVALRFIGGFFFAGVFPCINALFAENTSHDERGKVFGLSYSAQQIGSIAGPILGGYIATWASNAAVILAHGALVILLLIFLFLMRPKNASNGTGKILNLK